MGWGLGIYDPVKIRVKTPCNGYYLMWYYSGWHYWYFLPGRISVLSEGEEYRRIGTQKLSMSSGQIDRDQAAAIRTILLTKEIYILTDYWWKNLRIDPGSVVFYDNSITGAEIEFVGIIGNRLLSMTGFSPESYSIIIPVTLITYGILYNWYAANDVRNIANAGWHLPSQADFNTLNTYLGGELIAGGKLKEIGTVYWHAPNTGATNEVGFNGRGTAGRSGIDGTFYVALNITCNLHTTTLSGGGHLLALNLLYNQQTSYINEVVSAFDWGYAIRLMKDSTTLTHGQTGTYTDPSGFVYRTICIGTQEWVADNIITQHYRNGDPIPNVTDNTAWAALITGALCAYNNDWSNV
jgi:uncharacterized protein (TIGR02145 family)